MPAALIVQLLVAVIGQLPELAKIVEELHQSGATTLTPDQEQRCNAATGGMQNAINAMWPKSP